MQNSDATNCGITSCSIKTSGCSGAYSPGQLSMAGSTPWAITANQNIQNGYTETVCVSCTNGLDTYSYFNFIVTQIRDCATALTAKAGATNSFILFYQAASTGPIGEWTTYFDDADTTNCAITSCVIKSADCSGAYAGSHITIASSLPFAIEGARSIQAGWTETICVECTNGD